MSEVVLLTSTHVTCTVYCICMFIHFRSIVPIDIGKNLFKHEGLVEDNNFTLGIAVGTGMNNPIHIKVKVVDTNSITQSLIDSPIDVGILVREPPKHFWNAKECC